MRIEVLSPTVESFNDYNSPALQAQLNTGNARVIPNDNLGFIRCPRDVPGCNSDPNTNSSGQTLADANLLKIRVTYGIPQEKQMPMVGRFYTWALARMNPNDTDAFRSSLVQRGRIPLVAHTTVRMMSPPIEGGNGSNPGPGNNGNPVDPGQPARRASRCRRVRGGTRAAPVVRMATTRRVADRRRAGRLPKF